MATLSTVASPQKTSVVYRPTMTGPSKKSKACKEDSLPEVPKVIDNGNGRRYFRGRLLGKGGFARVYEVTDMSTNKMYALKVVHKARLSKSASGKCTKIESEIELHKTLRYQYIVGFHGHFQDENNVYIVLELCSKKSLVQMLRNRGKLTEPEVRFFMHQAIQACAYLHSQRVIHRDIKVGNFFINADMELRLGDFGLAIRLKPGETRIRTMCGTPNYIAPEVLTKEGHSFKVDTWALGCVMYTLLVGHPPFETKSLRETYQRIRSNDYTIPSRISDKAARLIQKMLQAKPHDRPCVSSLLSDDFFSKAFFPKSIPTTAILASPKWSEYDRSPHNSERKKDPLKGIALAFSRQMKIIPDEKECREEKACRQNSSEDLQDSQRNASNGSSSRSDEDEKLHSGMLKDPLSLEHLYSRLSKCLLSIERNPDKKTLEKGATTLPGSLLRKSFNFLGATEKGNQDYKKKGLPGILFVTKWVDYSNKYGFGAQLSDGTVVVLFNDSTKILLSHDKSIVQYCSKDGTTSRFLTAKVPNNLQPKFMLLTYFANYMDKHLLKGGDVQEESSSPHHDIPYVDVWFRTDVTMAMYLSNGTIQVNFFDDHTKVVLLPEEQDVFLMYVDGQRHGSSHVLSDLAKHGCSKEVFERLNYCKQILKTFVELESRTY